MEKALHKRITIISVIIMVLATLAEIVLVLLIKSGRFHFSFDISGVSTAWVLLMTFSVIALLTSYSIINKEKSWIRKTAKYTLYVSPLILTGLAIGLEITNNIILLIVLGILMVVATAFTLMPIFVFANPVNLTSTIIFLSLIIVSILLKRFHFFLAGICLTVSLGIFSLGSYMYGIRCLYLAEKNRFLKYVAFLGSCVVTIFLMGLLFKVQHWALNPFLVSTGQISLVLGTIVVLLALPSSGFVEWQPLHKKILRRLIFPWALIFLLFIIRFLLPEVDAIIWPRQTKSAEIGFGMDDYTIENKNNLKPE
jgi:hypothetical protein